LFVCLFVTTGKHFCCHDETFKIHVDQKSLYDYVMSVGSVGPKSTNLRNSDDNATWRISLNWAEYVVHCTVC